MKAFTLIEMIVYFGLVSLLMLGSVGLAYSVTDRSGSDAETLRTIEDGTFVLQKIAWATSQAGDIEISSSALRIRSLDVTIDPIHISYENGSLFMQEGYATRSRIVHGVELVQFEEIGGVLYTALTLRGRNFSSVHTVPHD